MGTGDLPGHSSCAKDTPEVLVVFNSKNFLDYVKVIYPSKLIVKKVKKSDHHRQ